MGVGGLRTLHLRRSPVFLRSHPTRSPRILRKLFSPPRTPHERPSLSFHSAVSPEPLSYSGMHPLEPSTYTHTSALPVCASSPAVVSVRSWSSGIGRHLGVWLEKSTAGVVECGSEGGSTGCRPYLRQVDRTIAGTPILASD
ncbi:hypothetical protein BHE74_00015375 [Ensete ventricosum]|nr:hypothetical protein BHE74_00015375 [Ensete ventricosum]